MISYMYMAPGQGQTAPRGQTETSCHFFHLLQIKKKKTLKSDLMHFFHDLMQVMLGYSPGARIDSPRGQNFDVNRKALTLYLFVVSLKNLFQV